ncbi:hypothetical protein KDJ21_014585 [Metabacillus litoralis]|uniref:YphA family membrane protein n=1 Tax=Metabacillus litoralis TaxID=152268 RepID=UPI001B946D56|nr:hypothetical protein [Metabacillus litoralis]UHA58090.1 hypothetical protein KDJ21_014585 [Metabacillus litoralis]
MEGIIFYWFMWLGWVVVTFIMKKNKSRLKLAFFLLVTILISKVFLVVSTFYINCSLIMFLLLGYYLAVKNKRKLVTFYLTNLTLTFAYAGIMLFHIYDPVWFVFDYRLIVSLIVSFLAIYLGKNPSQRFTFYLISVSQGEFLYWLIMSKFHDQVTFGTAAFLDMLVIGCAMIYLWTILQQFTLLVEQSLHRFQKQTKEKQG